MGMNDADTIPLQVFMVSSHARYLCVQVYWGVTDLEEGYQWDTDGVGSSHGSGSICA